MQYSEFENNNRLQIFHSSFLLPGYLEFFKPTTANYLSRLGNFYFFAFGKWTFFYQIKVSALEYFFRCLVGNTYIKIVPGLDNLYNTQWMKCCFGEMLWHQVDHWRANSKRYGTIKVFIQLTFFQLVTWYGWLQLLTSIRWFSIIEWVILWNYIWLFSPTQA